MGYTSKDIAIITEPKTVSLSNSPNFVTFASKPAVKTYLEATVKINALPSTPTLGAATIIRVTEPSGEVHEFHGTTDPDEVSGAVFLVSATKSDTAENLRQAILTNRWINANFSVIIPATWAGGALINGETLNIKSKGAGAAFIITITAPNNTADVAYTIAFVSATSTNNDSISGEESTAEIELDIYASPAVSLGEDDRPLTAAKIGTYATSLQKTYAGVPAWFELNALNAQYGGYNVPPASGWFNTGTARVFRFAAKVRGDNSFTFYQSNALFVINGYAKPSENMDLTPYIYEDTPIQLLTNKPRTDYVRGQKEYLNFIFKKGRATGDLRIAYRVYSTSDLYLGVMYFNTVSVATLAVVNTCVLSIDAVLDAYPKAGILRVSLARGEVLISSDLEYNIRPDSLHDLKAFSFVNKLGGWDSFNFNTKLKNDIKPEQDTYTKTLTPDFKRGESLETVYSVTVSDTYTAEGAPVSDEVALWIKELAAAKIVLDDEGNYIIKEDFTISVTAASKNMQVPTLKYSTND